MKIEIDASGINVENLLTEYMRRATPSALMGRVAAAALEASKTTPVKSDSVVSAAFADWAKRRADYFRVVESSALEYSEEHREIGKTSGDIFADFYRDAINEICK